MADEASSGPGPAPATRPKAARRSIGDEIRAWFVEHMHGSLISRDTQVFNHVQAATEKLIARLEKQFGKGD